MASEKPSAWAITEARHTYLYGSCKCDEAGACPLHLDIATALDAARNKGRREREAEIVKFLRGEAASALNILDVADDIERGAGRKENERG